MPQPSPQTTTNTLPSICWFTGAPYPNASDVTSRLNQAGFTTVATTSAGLVAIAISLRTPDGSTVQISPEPTSGYGASSKFDLTASIQLTLGRAPL